MRKPSIFLMIMMAWVLWYKATHEQGNVTWIFERAFEGKKECDSRARLETNYLVARGLKRIDSTTAQRKGKTGLKTILGFFCLPATIDPRPR